MEKCSLCIACIETPLYRRIIPEYVYEKAIENFRILRVGNQGHPFKNKTHP
jgi:hypothetical protein